jgi:hypothetical protein
MSSSGSVVQRTPHGRGRVVLVSVSASTEEFTRRGTAGLPHTFCTGYADWKKQKDDCEHERCLDDIVVVVLTNQPPSSCADKLKTPRGNTFRSLSFSSSSSNATIPTTFPRQQGYVLLVSSLPRCRQSSLMPANVIVITMFHCRNRCSGARTI